MRFILLISGSLLMINIYAQAEKKFVRHGNNKYKDGNYKEAEIEYRKALDNNAEFETAEYNLGNALYKQKQYDASIEKYASLAEQNQNKKDLNKYYYNMGNSFFENQQYKESVDAYKNALRNDPDDMDAKHNLQKALQMIRKQEQQQQQQQQQGGDDQQKNDQSQENKDQQSNQNQDQQSADNNGQSQDDGSESQDQQQPYGEISKENAERILQALENDEKDVIKKVQDQKQQTRKTALDKNW